MRAREHWLCWWAGVLVLRGERPIELWFDGRLFLINLGTRGLA
jgi:hypothetical protein